jgi:hypothetical protein
MNAPVPYTPTPAEAKRDLGAWCRRREQLRATCGIAPDDLAPGDWIPIAVGTLLDELERHEDANRGMVLGIDDLDALPEEVAEC